jgi:hypothetical protein
MYFSFLTDEFASLDAPPGGDLGSAISDFRRSGLRVAAWRAHTNTTIVERLLVEKFVQGWGAEPASARQRDVLHFGHVDSAAVVNEPLYLLQCYATIRGGLDTPSEEIAFRVGLARRCIGALRQEVRAVQHALETLERLVEVATTDKLAPMGSSA